MKIFSKARQLLENHGVTPEATITLSQHCSEAVQRAIWGKYVAYRKAGYIAPFHVRRTPYKVKLFMLENYIIKEYTGARDKVEKEVAILRQLHHETLISFLFVADQGSRISIVMDWAGESLRLHRTVSQPKQYNEAVARHMIYQLTNALVYLHSKGIVHRDIKPDNIGVLADQRVALFDWGEALTLDQVEHLTDRELAHQVGVAGTPLFMPPEVLNYLTDRDLDPAGGHHLRSIITTAVDVWGLGTVLFFLLAGRDIFVNGSSWELTDLADIAGASTGVELPLGVEASYAARDFLRACLQRDPAARASAKQLWQHPWLMGASTAEDMEAAEMASRSALATAPSAGTRTAMLSVLAESFSSEDDDSSSSGAAAAAAAAAASASYCLSANPLLDSLALTSGIASVSLAAQEEQQQQQLAALLQPMPVVVPQQQPQWQQPQQQPVAASAYATLQGFASLSHLSQCPPARSAAAAHHRIGSLGSCKSLAAAEEELAEAAAAATAASLQAAAGPCEAVCEIRLRPSPSAASLASVGSAPLVIMAA